MRADASVTRMRVRATTMTEALQKALRSFGGGQDALSGETLTPEVLDPDRSSRRYHEQRPDLRAGPHDGYECRGAVTRRCISVPQHIIFALNDSECTFPAGSVQAIERLSEISTVPNTVSWVLGIIHLHGSILSVVDLRGFLWSARAADLTSARAFWSSPSAR